MIEEGSGRGSLTKWNVKSGKGEWEIRTVAFFVGKGQDTNSGHE